MLKNRQTYEKPILRKVRLEVKTSVLAVCHTSMVSTPDNRLIGGGPCNSPTDPCVYPQ